MLGGAFRYSVGPVEKVARLRNMLCKQGVLSLHNLWQIGVFQARSFSGARYPFEPSWSV